MPNITQMCTRSVLEDAQAQPAVSVTPTQSTLTTIVYTPQRYCNSDPRQTQLIDAVVTFIVR